MFFVALILLRIFHRINSKQKHPILDSCFFSSTTADKDWKCRWPMRLSNYSHLFIYLFFCIYSFLLFQPVYKYNTVHPMYEFGTTNRERRVHNIRNQLYFLSEDEINTIIVYSRESQKKWRKWRWNCKTNIRLWCQQILISQPSSYPAWTEINSIEKSSAATRPTSA